MNLEMQRRVAAEYLWIKIAKPQYLKAIDWTLGLVRDIGKNPTKNISGKTLGAPINEVLRRLIELRKAASAGVRLDTILKNREILSGKGATILGRLEAGQDTLLPNERDFAAFMKTYSNNLLKKQEEQARYLEGLIAKRLDVPATAVRRRLMDNKNFMIEAHAAVSMETAKAYKAAVSSLKGGGGAFSGRMKAGQPSWGKQGRKGIPFIEFDDLIGCRSVLATIQDMASACAKVQKSMQVLDKDNKYLQNMQYNGVHYGLGEGKFCVEYQVKTDINLTEATLSHDLIYAKEKRIRELPQEQEFLIGLVIDVATQLSMRDWAEYIDMPIIEQQTRKWEHVRSASLRVATRFLQGKALYWDKPNMKKWKEMILKHNGQLWEPNDSTAPPLPWGGKALFSFYFAPGVSFIEGTRDDEPWIKVDSSAASKLSPEGRAHAEKGKGGLYYEGDELYALPLIEIPKWWAAYKRLPMFGYSKKELMQNLLGIIDATDPWTKKFNPRGIATWTHSWDRDTGKPFFTLNSEGQSDFGTRGKKVYVEDLTSKELKERGWTKGKNFRYDVNY